MKTRNFIHHYYITFLQEHPIILMKKKWSKIPASEISRLEKTLQNHLWQMKVKKQKEERILFVKNTLQRQKNTCAFADGDSKFCWNHPKDKDLKYVKLEWGHKIPRAKGKDAYFEENLILLCARCNNQIQTSKTIDELIPELEHKLQALKKL